MSLVWLLVPRYEQLFRIQEQGERPLSYYKSSLFLIALVKAKESSSACSLYSAVTDRHGQALWVNVISQLGASSTHLHSLLA